LQACAASLLRLDKRPTPGSWVIAPAGQKPRHDAPHRDEPRSDLQQLACSEAAGGHRGEPRVLPLEGDRHGVGRPVAVLGQDQVRLPLSHRFGVVQLVAVDEQHDVRVPSSELWTTMPSAMKLCVPGTVVS
jgi:hypothetical protein